MIAQSIVSSRPIGSISINHRCSIENAARHLSKNNLRISLVLNDANEIMGLYSAADVSENET